MKELQLKPSYIVHLPKSLNIDEQLRKHPLKLRSLYKKEEYVIDYIALILGEIMHFYLRSKDLSSNEFVNIHSSIFKKLWAEYSTILNWAGEAGIIESDNKYIPDEKSYGYAFSSEFSPESTKQHYIKTPSIIKKLSSVYTKNEWTDNYPLLYRDIQALEIDRDAAYLTLEELSGKKSYDRRTAMVDNIVNGRKHFIVDRVGRLHTPVVSLKRELRKHLHIGETYFKNIDIKNSQPFFSLILLDETKYESFRIESRLKQHSKFFNTDKSLYKQLIHMCQEIRENPDRSTTLYKHLVLSGRIYEYLQGKLGLENRDLAKKEMFRILFSPPHLKGSVEVFKALFPEVAELFAIINKGYVKIHRKIGDQTSTLALILQSIESEVILNHVVPMLRSHNKNTELFTIHDSVMVDRHTVNKQLEVMSKAIQEATGLNPTLSIE